MRVVEPQNTARPRLFGPLLASLHTESSVDHNADNDDMAHQTDSSWAFTRREGIYESTIATTTMTPAVRGHHGGLYHIPLHATSLNDNNRQARPGERTSWFERSVGSLRASSHGKILCLHRFKVWWMRPVFIGAAAALPAETILTLFRDENTNSFRLVLPMERTTLQPTKTASSSEDASTSNNPGVANKNKCSAITIVSELPIATVYSGMSDDPYELLKEGVNMITGRHGSSSTSASTATSASTPAWSPEHNTLGWCTWNAFYTQVAGPKVVDAARQLREDRHIPVRWMILDDGWQHTTNDHADDGKQWNQRLLSLHESPTKFQQLSLRDTVTRLHSMGMDKVWVWHTLSGYWMGLNVVQPNNHDSKTGMPSASLYYPCFPSGILDNDHSAQREPSVDAGVGIPHDAQDFYERYHTYLASCGVDGVKVDAQGVVGVLRKDPNSHNNDDDDDDDAGIDQPQREGNESSTLSTTFEEDLPVDRLQDALASSVNRRFRGSIERLHDNDNTETVRDADVVGATASSTTKATTQLPPSLIQCMAHDPQLLYKIPSRFPDSRPLVRASDDHYPNNSYSHGTHVTACAFNSLLLGGLALPDWDMFRTDLPNEWSVRLHAVARCLSGGPVCVSDPPDSVRRSVVRWIACPDGTVLTCRDHALPVADCLLDDPLLPNAKPLILGNINNSSNGNGSRRSNTSAVFGVFALAGSGEWNYQKLDYTAVEDSIHDGNSIDGPIPQDHQRRAHTVTLSPRMIPRFCPNVDSDDDTFLAFSFFDRHSAWMLNHPNDTFTTTVHGLDCEAIAVVPVVEVGGSGIRVVPMGYTNMINSAGAVVDTNVMTKDAETVSLVLTVRGCGDLVVAVMDPAGGKPQAFVDGELRECMICEEGRSGVDQLGFQQWTITVDERPQGTFNTDRPNIRSVELLFSESTTITSPF